MSLEISTELFKYFLRNIFWIATLTKTFNESGEVFEKLGKGLSLDQKLHPKLLHSPSLAKIQ